MEQKLENKVSEVCSFNDSIFNIKEMTTFFKDKNHKKKKKYIKYKTLATILKSFDTFVIVTKTSSSIPLSLTAIRLIVRPISDGIVCGLTTSNKVIYEMVMQKYSITKNNKKKINKLINCLINYLEKVYNILWLIKMNKNLYVIFSLKIW